MTVLPLAADGPMKARLIALAFEDCKMSEVTVTPEEHSLALRKLNSMMKGGVFARIPYAHPLPNNDGEANEPSGIPTKAENGVVKELAMILHGVFSIEPSTSFRRQYSAATLEINALYPPDNRLPSYAPGTIRGAGAKAARRYVSPFFPSAIAEDQ